MKALPEPLRLQLIALIEEAGEGAFPHLMQHHYLHELRTLPDVTGEAVATIHEDGYWTRANNPTGKAISEAMHSGKLMRLEVYAAPTQSAPLITVEASLRFCLESEQQKSADLLDEVRELKGKLAAQSAQIPDHKCGACGHEQSAIEYRCDNCGRSNFVEYTAPQPPQETSRMPESEFFYLCERDKVQPPQGEGNA